MITHTTKTNRGFTLVETLVAVAILMIAISGPLTIANQALTAALGSRNAMIATYLAQEGMESIKNIKDNNLAKGNDFGLGIVGDISSPWCTYDTLHTSDTSHTCATPDASQNITNPPILIKGCQSILPQGTCDLYTKDGVDSYIYSDNSDGLHQTPFTRYYYVTANAGNTKEFIVTVVVSWYDGAIPNEIRLQELMTNASRS